jgi:hypothetical protein
LGQSHLPPTGKPLADLAEPSVAVRRGLDCADRNSEHRVAESVFGQGKDTVPLEPLGPRPDRWAASKVQLAEFHREQMCVARELVARELEPEGRGLEVGRSALGAVWAVADFGRSWGFALLVLTVFAETNTEQVA